MEHPSRDSAASVPYDDKAISLKNLLHELRASKEAAARILMRENPELIKEWRERTERIKANSTW